MNCATVWYASCTATEKKDLNHVVKVAQCIVGMELPQLDTIYVKRLVKKANSIIRNNTHPSYSVLELLPSAKRFRIIKTQPNRLRNSFYPRAVTSIIPHSENRD